MLNINRKSILKKTLKTSLIIILVLSITKIADISFTLINNFTSSYNEIQAETVLSKNGSRGEEVRRIQKKLKELGYYSGSIDGIFGNNTEKAVKEFQKKSGITVDGIVGPVTLKKLGLSGSSQLSSNDVYLLSKVIEAEARGESYTGQVAVGAVVLNRVDHASFPDSVSGVIYQSGAFDCVYDSNWKVEPSATAKKAAQDAINGWDPSGGAIFYFNPAKTNDKWIRTRPVITVIGRHHFCA